MKKETYIKMTQPFRKHQGMARALHRINQCCTRMMYLAYPLLLVYLFFQKDEKFFQAFCVPAVSFVLLSLVRKKINRQRPYEKFNLPPVIKKETKGNSFPSRHVFSATMIAMTFLLLSPWQLLGVVFLALSLLLAVVRVVSGVHFISDVIAGMLVAILIGVVGYVIF